jgi:ABC-type bacteriocin/lantibiotic exporter with double-glycine peptidase domain
MIHSLSAYLHRSASPAASLILAGLTLILGTGCEQPRTFAGYPAGSLQVRYEASTKYSGCLIACVAMAANYLTDTHAFSEAEIRRQMEQAGLDETRIADVSKFLVKKGLHLVTLSGRLGGKPPASLAYWVNQRGYPAICVINRQPDSPAFNHAVVVIGISPTGPVESADTIHYLDPSSPKQLHTEKAAAFEANWARGQHAMMIVVCPPATRPAGGDAGR